ncbi:MAG: hypothetical protein ABSC50_02360 [Candidatus Bathyarchaeia archaeon]|jgi:hypothetical protein
MKHSYTNNHVRSGHGNPPGWTWGNSHKPEILLNPTNPFLHAHRRAANARRGEILLVKCLKCGGEVAGPAKEWDMHPKDGRGPALHIKHFSCPQCGKKFRLATKLAGA